ncbi:hypothetical protein R6V09_01035 [Streptomyces sp. W16]|uniref:hypothetical protein n=1 Tax=Streptomyces sp. W16 TaxID=3076631 RepID=UPI00295A87D1|nr:hypothetical protein [Streptomyces sp. W16]MDV9168727.1 hypothetical protein [Streptomyces sp. W16]
MSEPIRISLSESKGPIPGGPVTSTSGTVFQTTSWASTCPGCGKVPTKGQKITKIFYVWWHATCGAAYLRSTAADEAWLALAHQLERAPSKFCTAEIKAITRNLLRISGAATTVPDTPDGRRVYGDTAVAQSLPAVGEARFDEVVDGFYGSDMYAAVLQAEQRHPDELPITTGIRAWKLLDAEQQAQHLPELLLAYVELTRQQRAEDCGEGLG